MDNSVSQATQKRSQNKENKELIMEKRAWTAHGETAGSDKQVISALANESKMASRIFVTGEVHESYVGDAALRLLININNVLYTNGASQEPLFVETKYGTVRMTRFNPAFVWRCFHPDIFVALAIDEAARLGVKMDPLAMDHFDFYESMIAALKKEKGEYLFPIVQKGGDIDSYNNAVYLSCLLLFEKPGYMDVPVAQHFADQSAETQLKYAEYRELNVAQQKELIKLRKQYAHIQALTNPELDFIVSLYEGEVKKC